MASASEEFRRLEGELELADPKPVYLLYGEETFFLKRAASLASIRLLKESLKDFNLETLDGDTSGPADWISRASSRPMMGNRRVVMVTKADRWLMAGLKKNDDKAAVAELVSFVERGSRFGSIVLSATQPDKRTKLFKSLRSLGAAFYFAPIKTIGEAERFLQDRLMSAGISYERGVCRYLAEILGSDMNTMLSELKRLKDFLGEDRKDLTMADVQGLIAKTRTHTVFEFTEAIAEGDGIKAMSILSRLLEGGIKSDRKTSTAGVPLVLLTLLSRTFRQMLMARSMAKDHGMDKGAIVKALGIHPFVADKVMRQSKRFSAAQLEVIISAIVEADINLKSTSIPARFLLEGLVFQLCA
jgi:DNA polymerase III subunit delta